MGILVLGPPIVAFVFSIIIAILAVVGYAGLHHWLKRGPILLFILLSVIGGYAVVSLPRIFEWEDTVFPIFLALAPCGVLLGFLSLLVRAR